MLETFIACGLHLAAGSSNCGEDLSFPATLCNVDLGEMNLG